MRKNNKGISLIEILMVIGIFAVLGVITTRAVLLSLTGSKKSDSQLKVRENLDYAVSVMERQLRNAGNISPCPNVDPQVINYSDSNNVSSSFSCVNIGPTGYIASGSARLTSDEIGVSACTFTCSPGTGSTLPKVTLDVQADNISISTEINLRTY